MDYGVGVDLLEVEMDAINEFLFGRDPDTAQHAARHSAEHGFNDVEPGAVFWREDEFEIGWVKTQPALCLFGNVRRVVVQQQANAGLRRVDHSPSKFLAADAYSGSPKSRVTHWPEAFSLRSPIVRRIRKYRHAYAKAVQPLHSIRRVIPGPIAGTAY